MLGRLSNRAYSSSNALCYGVLLPNKTPFSSFVLKAHYSANRHTKFFCHPQALNTLNTSQGLVRGCSCSRGFHQSHLLSKKGSKAAKEEPDSKTKEPQQWTPNDLEGELEKIQIQLKDDLSKLRTRGRFDPGLIEKLRVKLDKSSSQTTPISDLAQVIPKGRVLNILIDEQDHVKAVSSSIQSSDLSLTPQADPYNALQLNVAIPPPTTDARQQQVQKAKKLGEAAVSAVQLARQKERKGLKGSKLTTDDNRRALEKIDKIVEQGQKEVKKIVDGTTKALEAS